ncbi:inner membrane protein [Cnuella takakiae]|uniref:Inner membrane protein n=1 Tax=Cnuella takakiae TaxID=1302690 RepID=A0A1M5FHB4_9BACT|nr:cell envelope integrity protein CreD [Cnuella takakiae]OLY93766.1 cell envelope integrity protein CreD [Cnuella takakiae]SHF90903.1 inner membrane protein [Cnuella takakiae]
MNKETTTENIWQKSKLLVKGVMILVLVLVLLVPTVFIANLIEEREARQEEAVKEVSAKWAGRQNLAGPVLVLPYMSTTQGDSAGKKQAQRQEAYFLPDELTVDATINPQERSRGIFKVILYDVQNKLSGRFDSLPLQKLQLDTASILWKEAYVQFSLSDPKGLNEELRLKWNNQELVFGAAAPGTGGESRLVAPLRLSGPADVQRVQFSGQVHLNGAQSLYLTPVGRSTTFKVNSTWPHPSFDGAILPQQSSIANNGFTASWKSLGHNRSFPQQWLHTRFRTAINDPSTEIYRLPDTTGETVYQLGKDAFGVQLFVPVNGYQKTMRSIKYAVLCILLTFCAFFLVETANNRSVHPFQYALIGVALVLFYLLLLSFSEYIGFNWAYIIAATATAALIGWFVRGLLASGRLAFILSMILVLLYTYVFTILQLQDYALILGSVGLFITLAVIMKYARKFQW